MSNKLNLSTEQPVSELQLYDWSVFLSVSAALFSSLTVFGNALLILTIGKSRILQTPTNLFIVSLATAEILTGLFSIPLAASSVLVNGWAFSQLTCRMSATVSVIAGASTAYSLLALCLDRCIAVARPLRYSHLITMKTSSTILAYLWLQNIVLGFLPLGPWASYDYSQRFFLCLLKRTKGGRQHVVKESLTCYTPTTLMLLLVAVIIREVKSHHRIFAVVPVPIPSLSKDAFPGIMPGMRGFNRNTVKALRSLFLMITGYVVFGLPRSVLYVLEEEEPGRGAPAAIIVAVWASFISCLVNPIIIMAFNRKFRAQLKILVSPLRCNRLRPAKEVFTISTGLHTILEATLVVNMVKNEHASTTTSTRRRLLAGPSVQ